MGVDLVVKYLTAVCFLAVVGVFASYAAFVGDAPEGFPVPRKFPEEVGLAVQDPAYTNYRRWYVGMTKLLRVYVSVCAFGAVLICAYS